MDLGIISARDLSFLAQCSPLCSRSRGRAFEFDGSRVPALLSSRWYAPAVRASVHYTVSPQILCVMPLRTSERTRFARALDPEVKMTKHFQPRPYLLGHVILSSRFLTQESRYILMIFDGEKLRGARLLSMSVKVPLLAARALTKRDGCLEGEIISRGTFN
ncbi:hypothetical protein BV25DRAFT_832212 [Artomyces pyxidatus]|uniref:Uncharacterized protein n=1 Tax=Artomyces pyxidatus TaxID=48021 RepID=A0ACB8TGP3_9AGAM|nr:hypothetical protein BV25DRAFT_832212 [Artomyces pyxidatus]